MTRHFYKHRVTGIVAPLNDSFAAVFGDRFERVGATDSTEINTSQDAVTTQTPEAANPDNVADAPKEAK